MTMAMFLLTILFLILQNIGYKLVSRTAKTQTDALLCSGIIVSLAAVLSCFLSPENFVPNTVTVLLGCLFGLFFALCEFSYLMALTTGPMAYTSLFLSCSLVIPAAAGVIFWNEKMRAFQIAGIVLLIVSFILGLETYAEGQRANVKWLVFGALTFFSNGMVSVLQKTQQLLTGETQNREFTVVSFLSAAVLLWTINLLWARKRGAALRAMIPAVKKTLPAAALTAAAAAAGNRLILYSAARIPASLMFPVMNGGILIGVSLSAVLFFREHLTKKQWAGIVLGAAAVLLST